MAVEGWRGTETEVGEVKKRPLAVSVHTRTPALLINVPNPRGWRPADRSLYR
jgi:hypothetical protein